MSRNGNRARQGAADSVGIDSAAEPTHSPTLTQLPIARIRIGERHRREMGDVAGLAASMAELGLLHPIVVRPDGTLIAGERRLRAAQQLGWIQVPVSVVDLAAVVRGEFAENAVRKDFTLSEAVAIKRALEPLEKAAAKERMREGARVGKVSTPSGKTRDKVAAVTGMSGRTLEKAQAVVDAAEAEPEKYGKLLADMDRTGRANGVFRRLKIAKQAEQIRAEPSPWPGNGPYRVAVIDVPWPYEVRTEDPSVRGVRPYPTMSLEQIFALPVASLLHEDAILWVWTTNLFMRHAYTALDHWGLQERTILTWGKDRFGNGDWLRGQTEHAIMAVRGKPIVTLTNQSTLLHAPVRGHSVKPIEFYNLVESLCPAPRYADLFSRYRHNERWDCHGDEAPPPDEASGQGSGGKGSAKRIDLGTRFGRWTVTAYAGDYKWDCICECGTRRIVRQSHLCGGKSKSCGCLSRDLSRDRFTKHAMAGSKEYDAWRSMKKRCSNPRYPHYKDYGGRGITVCKKYLSFDAWFADLGPCPSPDHSLDRIDVNGHYEPGNVRWATPKQQAQNQRPRASKAGRMPPPADAPF